MFCNRPANPKQKQGGWPSYVLDKYKYIRFKKIMKKSSSKYTVKQT